MSRFSVNCKWCGDKPGGCLYCIEELSDSDEEKLHLINNAIEEGTVFVLAVRTTQEVLLRQVVRGGGKRGAEGVSAGRENGQAGRLRSPCTEHLWAHDADNFKRRHCTRPGCNARQVFRFLPEDTNRTGEWVDATREHRTTNVERRTSKAKQRLKAEG
jgi:hypothetical protein